jgi:iron complex outermembrane recepter protein
VKSFVFLLFALFAGAQLNAQSLSGNIIDTATGQPLVGASVYLPKLKMGAVTDAKGNYHISPLSAGTYQVEVHMSGYAVFTQSVTVSGDATLNAGLAVSSVSLKEVIITSLGNRMVIQRAPVPVSLVTHDMFMQQAATNVIDAIAKQPGITAITTGPGVSKPEVNGLGYNRVLTLFDGARQEDFQWGDEHGVLIDPYAVYNAEIIRGPASLQYGANAVAGVVSFKSQPPPPSGTIAGSIQSEYQTNNGLIGNSLDLTGNNHDISWDVRGSYEAAHSYWDPHDGYVWGTAFNQYNFRGTIGINKSWGSSRLTASILRRQIEIPDGNRDSASGRFEFDVPLNAQYVGGQYVPGSGKIYPTLGNFLSYKANIAGYQTLEHDEVWWQNTFNAGAGKFSADIGYTQSIRHEIDTGNVGQENMVVHDIPYSLKYQLEGYQSGLKLTTGINGMYEFENNYPEPPSPYVGDFEIPNYHLFDAGGYAVLDKDFKNLSLSAGLRYDLRTITGDPMYLANYNTPFQTQVPPGTAGAYMQFPSFSQHYTGFSGSIGGSYQLPQNNYIKLNLAKSYRAPAINELTSNELDPSNVFKIGDPNLKAEEGYEADAAIGHNGRDVNVEIDGFYNYITHFIFADRISNSAGGDSMQLGAPVYKYGANTAIIEGISGYLHIHPSGLKWFELNGGFTYIYSLLLGQSDSTRHVPFTPAPRLTSDVKVKLMDRPMSILKNTYFDFGLEHDWPQNDIYSALWNELPSYSYTLFNASVGTSFVNKKTRRVWCTVTINATNLMNISYVDHTSRPQYFWAYNSVENPTNFGATAAIVTKQSEGIYNMGRNIGFKVVIPIGIVKSRN